MKKDLRDEEDQKLIIEYSTICGEKIFNDLGGKGKGHLIGNVIISLLASYTKFMTLISDMNAEEILFHVTQNTLKTYKQDKNDGPILTVLKASKEKKKH